MITNIAHGKKYISEYPKLLKPGPLLLNESWLWLLFVNESTEIANYADDTTPYICLGGEKIQKSKAKSCLGSPLIINCHLQSMYIKSVTKPVKRLTYWLDDLVLWA